MAKIKFTSFIRRLNRRLINLGKKFGKESPIYQQQASKLDARVPAENIRFNKDGFIQIAKPKSLEEKGFSQYLLNNNLAIPTPTEVTTQYKDMYSSYASETEKPLNIYDFVNNMRKVNEVFNRFFDSSQIAEIMESITAKTPLDKDLLERGKASLSKFMEQRETGKKPSYDDFINIAKVVDKYGI